MFKFFRLAQFKSAFASVSAVLCCVLHITRWSWLHPKGDGSPHEAILMVWVRALRDLRLSLQVWQWLRCGTELTCLVWCQNYLDDVRTHWVSSEPYVSAGRGEMRPHQDLGATWRTTTTYFPRKRDCMEPRDHYQVKIYIFSQLIGCQVWLKSCGDPHLKAVPPLAALEGL